MKQIILSILLFWLLNLAGCQDLGEEAAPLESGLVINLSENLAPSQRTLTFNCSTEKIYGCMNFRIINRVRVGLGSIAIWFDGIDNPHICLTALGPARANIELGTLTNGNYNITISTAKQITQATLDVTADRYVIVYKPNLHVSFEHRILYRVPSTTYWGFIGYHRESSLRLAQEFVDSLRRLGTQPVRLSNGYYGYFETDSSGNIITPNNLGYYFVKPFAHRFVGDSLAIRSLVKRFGKSLGDSLTIRVYGSRGEAYYSWVLKHEP